jgi:Cu(I)/Ag(I) efflux system membrane fusion protein
MPGMPGMKMPRNGDTDRKSDVPGYSKVKIPDAIQQRIGVTTGRVEEDQLRMSVRTVGIVRPDETKQSKIHVRTEGWVEKLYVNFAGQKVKAGTPLLEIYSPQFAATQQEYLTALGAGNQQLAKLAKRRLELWGVSPKELKQMEESKEAQNTLVLRAPLNGTVLSKNVLAGEYITPQTELYSLADLSTVWVQAKVYEYELPHVESGQPATVTIPGLPESKFTGKVVFVQPTVDEKTRTVQVRVELPNPKGDFKPGMFAHVIIEHVMGKGLQVPTSAVMRTGERDIVFRVESPGAFVPVEVTISPLKFEKDRFHVMKGLKQGDEVVTSGNFLIDSESRLHMSMAGMAGMPGMEKGDQKGNNHSKMKH